MASSNGNTFRVTGPLCGSSPITGEFTPQRPVKRSFDVFFGMRLNKRLSEQPWGGWFETPPLSLWHHCNDNMWRANGTSELVSVLSACRETKEVDGSTFVSLGVCDGKVPWNVAWWRHQMETFSVLLAICAGKSPVRSQYSSSNLFIYTPYLPVHRTEIISSQNWKADGMHQRPVTRSFDVFFDLRLNKRLSKQSWGWWFETLSCPLWRHCNGEAELDIRRTMSDLGPISLPCSE